VRRSGHVQIVIVIDLFYLPADDGLVLFCRHGRLTSLALYATKAS
jgi:hypothetical protein